MEMMDYVNKRENKKLQHDANVHGGTWIIESSE